MAATYARRCAPAINAGPKLPEDPFLVQIAGEFSLEKMLNMTDKFYAQRVVPLMHNYIKEKKYFQRNAAIAIGNVGDPEYVPHLIKSMADSQELVRGYAAWALGKIGGTKARNALESALHTETTAFVKQEINFALTLC